MTDPAANSPPWATVDKHGRLLLPPELAARYGLEAGAEVRLEPHGHHLRLHRPVTQLVKIYVEPTDLCNLDCVTCIRHNWDGLTGRMRAETFDHILAGLADFDPRPTVFFGGLGEPLFHPRTTAWVEQAKQAGARVELITNGTTLDQRRAQQLIDAGLDVLWVSLDGATPKSYADVRLGAELPHVIANIQRFRRLRRGSHFPTPKIGVAFVAMARNVHELPEVLALGRRLGATLFSVSNVLPYTAEMQGDVLYAGALRSLVYMTAPHLPHLSLPKMDINAQTRAAFNAALNSGCNVSFAGNSLGGANDVCNFIEGGTLSIAWDGCVSPCWPLMHDHTSYLHGKPRHSRRHVVGHVSQGPLRAIWLDPAYVAYRQRVQSFAFAPCTFCGGCDLSEANEQDCLGNTFPVCGGCLWAQGVIQCP
jgi:MoaA/NifB/PqqE/SkfB family radical SAM enzyme